MNIMVSQKRTDDTVEEACARDLSSLEGAKHLVRCITYYWASRGFTVTVEVVPMTGTLANGGAVYGVRSKGIPVGKNLREPEALAGRRWV